MADEIMRKSTELDALVPEFWSASFYPTLLAELPFNDVVDRTYEGEISALGDQVNIVSFPQFDLAQELPEDARADASAITATQTQLVINKQVVQDFILTKVAMRQSIDAMNKLRNLALHSIMKKMQDIIINESVPSASSPDHQISFDSGTTLQLSDMLSAKELLDQADVPDDGTRCMINGVSQANQIFNISGFVSRDFIPSGSPLSSGSFPTPILGFRPKMTSVLGDTSYVLHPSYLSLAVQEEPEVEVHGLGADGRRGTRVNMTSLFGVKILDDERLVQVS